MQARHAAHSQANALGAQSCINRQVSGCICCCVSASNEVQLPYQDLRRDCAGDNQAEAPELSQAKQLLASEKKGSMLWASEDNELMQLALAEYFQENVGADLVQLSPSAAASLAPEANSVSFEEKYYETLWLTQPDLKWWGNFFSVLGCVVGIVGLVAAPFSMGAGLGLAVLGGVLTLVGVGLTWYADKTKRQYRPTMRYSSDGRVSQRFFVSLCIC